jgi:hypothetical protein
LIAAGVALVLVAAGGLVAFALWEEDEGTGEGEFPTALGKHIEKLIESIPGRAGVRRGPVVRVRRRVPRPGVPVQYDHRRPVAERDAGRPDRRPP